MLNFRRLKQDFSPNILREGKTIHGQEQVLDAKILAVDKEHVRVTARVKGSYENVHDCEVEIDRRESEMIDSNCDCSYRFDCQHLAAFLFHLEGRLDALLVQFSKEADCDDALEEVQEVIEEAQKKEEERNDQVHQEELLGEYAVGSEILASSSFFRPREDIAVDRAELAVIFCAGKERVCDKGEGIEVQVALRLPLRSKPLHVPNLRLLLEAYHYGEALWIGGRRYFFTPKSLGEESRMVIDHLVAAARFIRGDDDRLLRLIHIDPSSFGSMLAAVFQRATEDFGTSGYAAKEDGEKPSLPCFYAGSLEKPLNFSALPAALQFAIEHLSIPCPKIFLKPMILVEDGEVSYDEVCLLKCCKPGLIVGNTYHRFQDRVRRIHLNDLPKIEEMTIPQPLFGTFIENALPRLLRIADVRSQEVLEQYPTLPFVRDLKARCDVEYLNGELEARLHFVYDGKEVPATQSKLTYEEATSFVREEGILARDLVKERLLIQRLFPGFICNEVEGTFVAKTDKKIVEFMTEIIPSNQGQVTFNCPENLQQRFIYDETAFILHFSEAKAIDVYTVELKVKGGLKGVKVDRLWECISAKRTYIELEKKKILVLDLEKLTPVVQLFDEIGLSCLDNLKEERPLWSLASLHENDFEDLPLTITISEGLSEIREQMLGMRAITPSPVPKNIKADLRSYQLEGVHWLERLRSMHLSGVLADDMGLGKTLQAIIALTQYHGKHKKAQSLVVCPTSLLYNWKEEFHKFDPTKKILVIDGTPGQRKKLIESSSAYQVLITSYSLLQKDIEVYRSRQFGYAVLDEAQHIKNRGTRNAKSVKEIQAAHRLVLTGTPVENSLDELWSLFDFLMPGLLSSYDRFVEKYIRGSGHSQAGHLEGLSKKVGPFILRRMKTDVLDDLPPVSHITYHCHLTPVQKELYQSYAESAREELSRLVKKEGFDKVQIHVLATLTRLKQICCHPAIFAKEEAEEGDSAKYEMLFELLHNLIEGQHKTVIFSQYTRMLGLVRADLEKLGIRFAYLDGSSKNRLELVKEFNEDPSILVFLVSLKAGGTGLNLVGADTVIHYDMWWNPAVENQATDRVHRIGQKRSVSSYKLVTLGTIEEKILELQKRKEALVKQVVSCDDEAVSKLTWEEVLELLQV